MTWGWESPTGPARGTVSRTARVSTVKWNLKAKHWPDEQKSHTRRSQWVRRPISSKPGTCTETADVDAAGNFGHFPRPPISEPYGLEISLALILTHITALRFGLPVI